MAAISEAVWLSSGMSHMGHHLQVTATMVKAGLIIFRSIERFADFFSPDH